LIEIREISDSDEKSRICDYILRALPSWFGNEAAIVGYAEKVRTLPLYAAYDGDNAVGFVAVKVHSPFAAEVCVMGILRDYHRRGIGTELIRRCEKYCVDNKLEYLTVKTLDESRESASYENTRHFYRAAGFKPLEVFPLFWDEDNPCLFMIKNVY